MKITESHYDTESHHRDGHLKLFVDNNVLTEIANKWFMENDIREMQIKSRAWNLVLKTCTNLIAQKIARHFGVDTKMVKYSRKCGCKCGCSPGYMVYLYAGAPERNHNAWANVDTDIDGIDTACLENIITHKALKLLAKDKQKEVDMLSAKLAANHKELAHA